MSGDMRSKEGSTQFPNAIVDPLNAGLDLKIIELKFYTLNITIFISSRKFTFFDLINTYLDYLYCE